jgi:ribosomal protein S18 acetylase RimI-like enzyme
VPELTIDLRPLTDADLPAAVALWNRAAGESFPLREELFRQVFDLNPWYQPDDSAAAWSGGRLVGFGLLGRYRGEAIEAAGLRDRTALTIVAVDPEAQRQRVGTRLVNWLIRRSGLNRTAVRPGGGPYFLLPSGELSTT